MCPNWNQSIFLVQFTILILVITSNLLYKYAPLPQRRNLPGSVSMRSTKLWVLLGVVLAVSFSALAQTNVNEEQGMKPLFRGRAMMFMDKLVFGDQNR